VSFAEIGTNPALINFRPNLRRLLPAVFFLLLLSSAAVFAQTQLSQPDQDTLVVEEATGMDIFAIGKTVIIKKNAKGVLSLGGDVIVEGRVEGDVAAVGGNIIQKEDAFIGGDVIILGGSYKHDREIPLRNPEKETVMIAVFEEELRNMSQNPAGILSPTLSWSFFAQRLLSALFWFLVSLGLTTIAPGAVSRAVTRYRLSRLKIFGLGVVGLFATTFGVTAAVGYLPGYVNALVGLMALMVLLLTYVFGRVVMQAVAGQWIQKLIFPEKKQSDTLILFSGALFWTALLSLPYVWAFAMVALLMASFGLVLTARTPGGWIKNQP
jgi:hypothetical protein